VYREEKIEMVAVFIKIMKKKNFARRVIHLAIIQKACALNYAMVLARKAETARLVSCINMAIKAKRLFSHYKIQYGEEQLERYRNQMRRLILFRIQFMMKHFEKIAYKMTGVVMFEHCTIL
jgi:hypothetical protein